MCASYKKKYRHTRNVCARLSNLLKGTTPNEGTGVRPSLSRHPNVGSSNSSELFL